MRLRLQGGTLALLPWEAHAPAKQQEEEVRQRPSGSTQRGGGQGLQTPPYHHQGICAFGSLEGKRSLFYQGQFVGLLQGLHLDAGERKQGSPGGGVGAYRPSHLQVVQHRGGQRGQQSYETRLSHSCEVARDSMRWKAAQLWAAGHGQLGRISHEQEMREIEGRTRPLARKYVRIRQLQTLRHQMPHTRAASWEVWPSRELNRSLLHILGPHSSKPGRNAHRDSHQTERLF